MFDLRTSSSVASLYAHHLGVTAVQADDWKIVSGGGEGLVCVWELRMRAKLWEMHNRWVVLFLFPPAHRPSDTPGGRTRAETVLTFAFVPARKAKRQ